jgi:hypothetical protein
MKDRRQFLRSAISAGVSSRLAIHHSNYLGLDSMSTINQTDDRDYWLTVMERIARPVLENLARRRLRKNMPVEAVNPGDRARYTHLEAFGRLLAGIAPWLGGRGLNESERRRQKEFIQLAHGSLDAATDPASPDFMNFCQGSQPLVDAAFLAQGVLRAPDVLWRTIDKKVQQRIIEALKSSRAIETPTNNNWVLFPAMIEAALHMMGEKTIEARLVACVRRMLGWYKGDGVYGDGEFFHFDYYNSFVIHPLLLDTLAVMKKMDDQFEPVYATVLGRARRYAEIQERLIAPDGTFPCVGRSAAYRFGALQGLSQICLMRELPEGVKPTQVRCAMTAAIRKMIEAPGTFDENGWLKIGFCGHQPSLAESYISTGSLYLSATALLPLGLPAADPFWSGLALPWTSKRIWSGESVLPDHAISEPL